MHVVFAFVNFLPFIASVGSGVGSGVGWNADSNIGSHVEILSKFFIGKNLLWKLLKTFSLALKNISKLFQIHFF